MVNSLHAFGLAIGWMDILGVLVFELMIFYLMRSRAAQEAPNDAEVPPDEGVVRQQRKHLTALQAPEEEPGNDTNTDYTCCGHNYCSFHAKDIPQPLAKDVFMLIMIYVPCLVIAVVLVVFFLDPLTRYGEGRKGSHSKNSTVLRNMLATFRQMKRTNQQMLIPLTVFIGLEQAWIAAEYTQGFVACALGVNMIGYVMITWGVMDSLACAFFGIAMKYIGRSMIIFIGASLNVIIMGFKLHYRPVPDHPVVFYALAGVWGISDAAWVTQIQAFYGLLFRRHKEAAFSNYRLFESVGFVLGFIYSSLLCIQSKLYIMLLILTLGLIGFLAVEVLYQNKVHLFNPVVLAVVPLEGANMADKEVMEAVKMVDMAERAEEEEEEEVEVGVETDSQDCPEVQEPLGALISNKATAIQANRT
ncbi:GL15593 [Drosophila persimilis]|uniref:GL15593 n=1 Tax=Drosophila persimilis TaxID=7234 RepID=B4H6P9_DROPE|nr:GL15593 [Drosophila persimilis]